MTGPEHYKEAERLIEIAAKLSMKTVQHAKENGADAGEMQVMASHSANFLAEAQVHATLALAAATAELDAAEGPNGGSATGRLSANAVEWEKVLSPAVSDAG